MEFVTSDSLDSNHSDLVNKGLMKKEVHCNTGDLMGPLGLIIQFLLALLAFSSLIAKRFCEPVYERRPWRIWFYDTSKQGFGAAVIHFANVFLADMFQGDPCTWYIVSFILDSTIGILVIYLGLKFTQVIVRRYNCESLKFGEYGNPAQCSAWVGQCGLYVLVMVIEKILMTLLIQFDFWKSVQEFLMSPVKDPHVELIIVMFIVPLVVNAFIFWVVDNFLKRKVKGTKTIYVTESDPTAKYNKSKDEVRCYNRIEKADEFESDLLNSTDDEPDVRHRQAMDSTERLLA